MAKTKEQSIRLGKEPIKSLLIEFSVPAIIGMLVNALYSVVDTIFIGRGVGEFAIGGVFVGMPIAIMAMAFGMLVGVGGNTLVSIRLGQDKTEDAERILANSFVLLIVISIILIVLGRSFLEPMLLAFGATESNLPYAMDYMTVIIYGAIFQIVGFGMNNFIRGEGNPKIAMVTMLIGALINTILDPIFIFILDMGIRGAALATVISQFISCVWVLRYFFGGKSLLKIRRENLRLRLHTVLEIFSFGFAPFSIQIAASMVSVLMNNSLKRFGGDMAISSMSVIQSIDQLVLMPVFGINQGVQPIIGYNYGAEKYDRTKEAFKYAAIAATVFTVLGFFLSQFFPKQLFKLFLKDKTSIENISKVGVPGLRIYMSVIFLVGYQVIGSNFFQATGQPKKAMLLSLSRQVLILIPSLILLPRLIEPGILGVWLATPFSDLIATFITTILLVNNFKEIDSKIEYKNK